MLINKNGLKKRGLSIERNPFKCHFAFLSDGNYNRP